MKDKKIFGLFLKEKRIEKGLSQKELSSLLYVTDGAISKWERGISYPDITLISELCKILDVSEHELLECCNDEELRKIKSDAKKYNNIRTIIINLLNISYLIALVVCFIVNLSLEHKLTWFFIVLTSLICAYTYLPTINNILIKSKRSTLIKFKDLFILLSQVLSLFILFLTCSIKYNNYWFMIGTLSTILAYFIIFYPILFCKIKKEYENLNNKFLFTYSLGISIILIFLFIFINIYNPFNIFLGLVLVFLFSIIPLMLGLFKIICIKHYNKIKLITIISLCVGIFIFLSISFISSIKVYNSKEELIYNIDDSIKDFVIKSDCVNVNVFYSHENNIKYLKNKNTNYEFKIDGSTLYINQLDNQKFYFSLFSSSLYLNLNISNIKNLKIDNETGNILLNDNLNLESLNLNVRTGNVKINNITVSNDIIITNETGNIKLRNINNNKTLTLTCSTGNINLDDISSNEINLANNTGNITLNNINANLIYASVNTGNIKGKLSSDYIYNTSCKTGNINVPNTNGKYSCTLKVKTGNINISLI